MGCYYRSQTNGSITTTGNWSTCCKPKPKFPSFPGWDWKAGQEFQIAGLCVCIQQAILGDKYGNGPLSSGTISFQRGRSGCAVRFD